MAHLPRCWKDPLRQDPPEIRLLKIEPGEDNPLRLSVTVANLDAAPVFDALSYVWGDQTVKLPIYLDGELSEVGSNLLSALRHLRTKKKTRFLWADAVCINQTDEKEKTCQLPLMTRIFSTAQSVICWLGEASLDSDLAISHLREINRNQAIKSRMMPSPSGRPPPAWDAICSLIRRPYWTRIWMIQEIQLAGAQIVGATQALNAVVFLCGNEQISGTHMFMAFDALTLLCRFAQSQNQLVHLSVEKVASFDYFTTRVRGIMQLSREPEYHTEIISFLNYLMIETSKLQATDPRDYLYALLGLLPPAIFQLIRPDYSKSTKQVFVDFALLTMEKRFGMIGRAGMGHQSVHRPLHPCPDMPSWVPRYDGMFIGDQGFSQDLRNTNRFKAGYFASPKWHLIPKTETLQVGGVRAGKVIAISRPEASLDARMVTWTCFVATHRSRDHPCKSWRRAFYHTILQGIDRDYVETVDEDGLRSRSHRTIDYDVCYVPFMQSAFRDFPHQEKWLQPPETPTESSLSRRDVEEYQYWREENVSMQTRDLREGDELRPEFVTLPFDAGWGGVLNHILTDEYFKSRVRRTTKDRSFVLCDDGYMGLAPIGARVGDHVVVLLGCPVPLLLRSQATTFQVVGDAYIYGLMEGQLGERVKAGLAYIEDLILI